MDSKGDLALQEAHAWDGHDMCHGWQSTGLVAQVPLATIKVPTPLPDIGSTRMLSPGSLSMEEEKNIFQHHLWLVQTLH